LILSVDTSKWKKVRASDAGIKNSMIPESSMNVLRLLRRQGFDAYLVGGCVRDLILNRVPKDYDVITTADLKQIRRLFHRAQVIGKRFPICHVWMGGSIIEVSSFDTVAHSDSDLEKSKEKSGVSLDTKANKNNSLFKMYSGWDIKDCKRWRNSLQRDFTINSLFYNPFDFTIYDYANGMEDLTDLKLRTLVPAHLSFKEDCARILRGLRIAARLGLSLSKDVKTAIPEFVSSVANLDQFRLIMEMNYMLAYGAAAPSILLLMKFKLLHVLLPFQAAYLDQASKTSLSSSLMLVRLFSNMDKLVSCDQPADPKLWIAVLAFHIALVRNPQEAIVVRAFAALLYHGNWSKAVEFAREHETSVIGYAPEVSKSSRKRSDEDLAEAVSEFTCLLKDTQYVLTDKEALREALYLYPDFKFSGLVFIPKKKGRDVAEGFMRLSDVESYESQKEGFSIDYVLLGKGNPCEVRFVLGKIILDTITEGTVIEPLNSVKKKQSTRNHIVPAACLEKKDELFVSKSSKEDNNNQTPVHDSNASSVLKILKRTREDSEQNNDQETEVCPRTPSGPAKNQDQSVVQMLKRRRSKEAPVSEPPKQKTSKRSRSDDQEAVGSLSVPAKIQHQSNKHDTNAPICELPKQKTSKNHSKESRKVKHNDLPVKEIKEAKQGFVSDKSMSDLLQVLEKSSQQVSSKEENNSLSSEKTNRPRKLSSLFR
jgi:poly(A) polymerase